MSKNYVVWLKAEENLRTTNTRYVSVNKAGNKGDPIGNFIFTIKNFMFDIALSTLWVPGEWQYQLCVMDGYLFVCTKKFYIWTLTIPVLIYIYFFYVKLLTNQGCVYK